MPCSEEEKQNPSRSALIPPTALSLSSVSVSTLHSHQYSVRSSPTSCSSLPSSHPSPLCTICHPVWRTCAEVVACCTSTSKSASPFVAVRNYVLYARHLTSSGLVGAWATRHLRSIRLCDWRYSDEYRRSRLLHRQSLIRVIEFQSTV